MSEATPSFLRFAPACQSRIRDSDSYFVVTGAGGWFGLATLEMLAEALGPAFEHRVFAFTTQSRVHRLRSGHVITTQPLDALARLVLPQTDVFIAHYAFLTREKVDGVGLDPYIAANRAITTFMERQAERLAPRGTFSTSSGAVYQKDGNLETALLENPYGVLKLEEEAAFARLGSLGARSSICRVFNVGGPFLNKEYAIGSLIRAALFEPEIVVRARRKTSRSFAFVGDIISAGFAGMLGLAPEVAGPYDTAGLEVIEVGDLAHRVRDVIGRAEKPIIRASIDDMSADYYVGNGERFRTIAQCAGFSLMDLDTQIRLTADYILETSR